MKEYFGELSVIGMKGCEKFVRRVDEYLCQWRKNERKTPLRMSSGDDFNA